MVSQSPATGIGAYPVLSRGLELSTRSTLSPPLIVIETPFGTCDDTATAIGKHRFRGHSPKAGSTSNVLPVSPSPRYRFCPQIVVAPPAYYTYRRSTLSPDASTWKSRDGEAAHTTKFDSQSDNDCIKLEESTVGWCQPPQMHHERKYSQDSSHKKLGKKRKSSRENQKWQGSSTATPFDISKNF